MLVVKSTRRHALEAMTLGLIGLGFFAIGFIIFPEPATFVGDRPINVWVIIGFLFFALSVMKPLYGKWEKMAK